MIAKRQRQKKRRINEDTVFQVLFFGIILLFIGFLVVSNYRVSKRKTELAEEIEAIKEEIWILEQRRQNLEAGISETQKESYWEEKVRGQGYVKEGEEQVIVIGPEEEENDKTESNQISFSGLLEKIKNLLAGVIQR